MSVVINGSAGVTTNSGAVYNGIASGTAVASTSGTSIDFTSIPSWVKRITVMLQGVSTNGSSLVQVQIGAGSVTTSGYVCSSSSMGASAVVSTNATSGFILYANNASDVRSGQMTLTLVGSNGWVCGAVIKSGSNVTVTTGGDVTLGGTLDRVRITTVNGTDTFDAGSINILYE